MKFVHDSNMYTYMLGHSVSIFHVYVMEAIQIKGANGWDTAKNPRFLVAFQ